MELSIIDRVRKAQVGYLEKTGQSATVVCMGKREIQELQDLANQERWNAEIKGFPKKLLGMIVYPVYKKEWLQLVRRCDE